MLEPIHQADITALVQVYVCGGINFDNDLTMSTCQVYDPETDEWVVETQVRYLLCMGLVSIDFGDT